MSREDCFVTAWKGPQNGWKLTIQNGGVKFVALMKKGRLFAVERNGTIHKGK